MAIRKRRGASGIAYQVYWKNPYTGAQECKTFHSLAEARKHDSLIKHQIQFETESFKPESLVRTGADRTVEDAVFLYLRDKKFSERYAASLLSALRIPLQHYGHFPLTDFTTQTWDELVKLLRRTDKSRGAGLISTAFVHNILSALRTIFRWAGDRGLVESLPKMKVPAANYARTIPPTPEEAQRIFSVAPEHLKRVIVLGMMLGLRVGQSELLALKWNHVDLVKNVVIIDTSHKNPNAPWREVPIVETIQPLFREWAEADRKSGIEYVISFRGKQVVSIKRSWASALRRAGITRRVRPYDLRHAFASQLIANGCDVGTVARLLGHSSPQMVFQHYQHVSTVQKREAIATLEATSVWQAGMARK